MRMKKVIMMVLLITLLSSFVGAFTVDIKSIKEFQLQREITSKDGSGKTTVSSIVCSDETCLDVKGKSYAKFTNAVLSTNVEIIFPKQLKNCEVSLGTSPSPLNSLTASYNVGKPTLISCADNVMKLKLEHYGAQTSGGLFPGGLNSIQMQYFGYQNSNFDFSVKNEMTFSQSIHVKDLRKKIIYEVKIEKINLLPTFNINDFNPIGNDIESN